MMCFMQKTVFERITEFTYCYDQIKGVDGQSILTARQGRIPNADFGLFTTGVLSKGECVGCYGGTVRTSIPRSDATYTLSCRMV